LNNITEEQLNEETEQAEELRKNLIAQDYQNRGYSEERIARELKKSFDSGNDKEDAIEALRSNIEFYTNGYNEIINEAKKAQR
jgi:transcriptional regulator NrdR family protein